MRAGQISPLCNPAINGRDHFACFGRRKKQFNFAKTAVDQLKFSTARQQDLKLLLARAPCQPDVAQ
jgi:hypothetical protein